MSQKALDSLHEDFKPLIVALLAELELRGIKCVVTSGQRTVREQDKLYAQGRTLPGKIVTKAQGGQSAHNFSKAADLCPVNPDTGELWWDAPDDVWNVIHLLAEERGYLDSGYDWKFRDAPHVEDPRWKEDRLAYLRGELDRVMPSKTLRLWLEEMNKSWWDEFGDKQMAIECPRHGWIDYPNDFCCNCSSCIRSKK